LGQSSGSHSRVTPLVGCRRADLAGRPPRSPTDPDVQTSGIRLLGLRVACAWPAPHERPSPPVSISLLYGAQVPIARAVRSPCSLHVSFPHPRRTWPLASSTPALRKIAQLSNRRVQVNSALHRDQECLLDVKGTSVQEGPARILRKVLHEKD